MKAVLIKYTRNGRRATQSTIEECENLVKQGKARKHHNRFYEEIVENGVSYETKVMEPKVHPNHKPRTRSRKPSKVVENENNGNGRGEGHGKEKDKDKDKDKDTPENNGGNGNGNSGGKGQKNRDSE